jgi:hypothetical protein
LADRELNRFNNLEKVSLTTCIFILYDNCIKNMLICQTLFDKFTGTFFKETKFVFYSLNGGTFLWKQIDQVNSEKRKSTLHK